MTQQRADHFQTIIIALSIVVGGLVLVVGCCGYRFHKVSKALIQTLDQLDVEYDEDNTREFIDEMNGYLDDFERRREAFGI